MILDYLLQHNPATKLKLNATDAIRHWQCGVLRFMVNKGLVKMEANASSNRLLNKQAPNLKCLERGRIPSSMTAASFLSFIAVEYDDLQTLQWLCESYETTSDTCDGWNLLHFSAYMGRVEIVAWLYTQPEWQSLVSAVSKRKPFQHAYAVHIAASEGHVFLTDMLLAFDFRKSDKTRELPKHPSSDGYIMLNHQVKDTKGKGVESYAKKSSHQFVQEWVAERNKPLLLNKNITKLHQLVSTQAPLEEVKEFIITTKCLEPATWYDCNYFEINEKGSNDSFGEVLSKCCDKYRDVGFAIWICIRLYFNFSDSCFFGSDDEDVKKNRRKLDADDLLQFAKENGYFDLIKYLSMEWLKDVSCVDPATSNLLLKTALSGDFLVKVRGKVLRITTLVKIMKISYDEVISLFKRGGRPDQLEHLLHIRAQVREALTKEGWSDRHDDYRLHEIDMSMNLYGMYKNDHLLSKLIALGNNTRKDKLHIVLATEGHTELLEYCLKNMQGWTTDMGLEVVRIAAFFGHYAIVGMVSTYEELLSVQAQCTFASVLGAGEACRFRDLSYLLNVDALPDPVKLKEDDDDDDSEEEDSGGYQWNNSLLMTVLYGYANNCYDKGIDNTTEFKTLRLIIDRLDYSPNHILSALKHLMDHGFYVQWRLDIINLLESIMETFKWQPVLYHKQMHRLCKHVVKKSTQLRQKTEDGKRIEVLILEWLGRMSQSGIDIQGMATKNYFSEEKNDFLEQYHMLEKQQLNNWSSFDIVKQEGTLQEIQAAIEQGTLSLCGRDRGGLLLTHLCAAYDRVDFLEWLVLTKGMDIKSMDGQSRTVLDVAKASKATSSTKWIIELQARRTIASFTQQNYHRLLAVRKHQRLTKATTSIQTIYRGYMTRKLYSGILVQRLEESQRFSAIWGHVIQQYYLNSNKEPLNWSSIRESVSDINQVEFTYDDNYFEDTDEQLSKALEGALQVDCDVGEEQATINDEKSSSKVVTEEPSDMVVESTSGEVSWLSFQMTSHVVKFLKQGDPKYKSFFVRRMQQLGSGERSRILQKRLKGSQSTIYETYLEQKSGFRILWTEEGENIVIWFVAKHKEVSRLMQLIDDSKSRTARQLLSESVISDLQSESLLPSQREAKKEVLLDVFSNVPLKLYDVSYQSIDDIATSSWSPKLHLTDEERDVVEADGTVLVLGRSGTGKTVCICNRMEYDRQVYGQDSTFSQLFVARSKRLCRYVSEATGNHDTNSFLNFDELVYNLDTSLPSLEGSDKSFFPSQRVDFMRFKQEFYNTQSSSSSKEKKVSAMILWTAIRTFIKGSIEAHQSPDGILPKDDFIAVEKLGKNRCRIPAEYRASMYDEFLKYEEYKTKLGLWDDIDRIQHLLSRLDKCMNTEPAVFDELRKSKIYVDEVQDYTQIEILLFFYLGGPGGLFLAGDPAQSVVEGTEFRFEEVRRVGYYVAESSGNRDLIPSKAKTVNVNFRSHAGILNAAASFLEYLFKYFPGSAKQLQTDYGLFQGSRPGVLHKVKTNQLATLLSDKLNGTVVLVHDASSDFWRKALGGYKLVYGIREAKGLEFKSVMILDFFSELLSSLHKPWRNLLLDREGQDFETKYPLVGTHLKLLYTGITRCIEQLFFVETCSSIAGDTIVRWLKQNELATKNNINDIESMAMTSDEFLSEGFNNAEQAESADELDLAYIALDRAVWCFEQADNLPLAAKARTNRRSIKFRLDLLKDSIDKEMVEVQGAQMMESLIREGLLLEVMNVFYSISPFMREYSKEQLENVFISKIRLALAQR